VILFVRLFLLPPPLFPPGPQFSLPFLPPFLLNNAAIHLEIPGSIRPTHRLDELAIKREEETKELFRAGHLIGGPE
jgi:hypothetical protein